MQKKVREFCEKEYLLKPGDGVIAGVSGGADSVCLLRVLCLLRPVLNLRIRAVHVHHGIRAEEADQDQEFVEKLCREWNVSLETFYEDVPELARQQHLSLEEAGRNVRYRIFEKVRAESAYDVIAVAHHMDDLAETVLMNMARGSGIRGMAGTRPVRDRIVRPLLCVRRSEIEQWLSAEGIAWRTDSTNSEEIYFRNRVRKQVLPQLEAAANERTVEHIAGLAADLAEADDYFSEEAKRMLEEGKRRLSGEETIREQIYRALTPPSVYISCDMLKSSPKILSSYLIRQALTELNAGLKDISRVHIEQVQALALRHGGKELMLPGGIRVFLEYDRLVFEKMKEKTSTLACSVVFRIFLADFTKKVPQNCCINWFDYDRINESIRLRSRLPKDRICVRADGATKKLKDYLIDARMPLRVRDQWPLLTAGGRVLWIPGYRMDEDLKVSQETKVILEAELRFSQDRGQREEK